jgi:hypothetical protein
MAMALHRNDPVCQDLYESYGWTATVILWLSQAAEGKEE